MALLPVADALEQVLAGVAPLGTEQVALADALGRVLAADLAAKRTQPPAAVSAMDGYAVRAADTASGAATLTVIGDIAAGHPFDGTVGAGQAARIFTGGVLPKGADAIVIQENTTRDGDRVTIKSAAVAGRHIRGEGIDFRAGDVLLRAGMRLIDRDLMVAAAMNYPAIPVHRQPRVAVLGTGDELVPPGAEPGPGEIVYSNGFALAALARTTGALVDQMGVVGDKPADIRDAIRRARDHGADVLVTTGGASVGDHDLVQKVLKDEGLALSFWRIAMRPGRPMLHGRLGPMQVLGLPGNPVSSYVCAMLFLVPLIRRLCGEARVTPALLSATLGHDLPMNDERQDYLRAVLTTNADGTLTATPVGNQDSSLMASLARADCLVIREPYAQAARAGSRCVILKLGL
jgi:molybdopterin molybdotransferase